MLLLLLLLLAVVVAPVLLLLLLAVVVAPVLLLPLASGRLLADAGAGGGSAGAIRPCSTDEGPRSCCC